MSFVQSVLKFFGNIFGLLNTPFAAMITLFLGIFVVAAVYLWTEIKPKKKILYCSEEENQGQEFTVARQTPAHLYTRKWKGDQYRFIRFREAFTFQVGLRTIIRWFAKKGTAYAKKLESGEVGPFTLYKVMKAVWGDDVIDSLQDEQKQKLIESEVMITVRLEGGTTPDATDKEGKPLKDYSELNVKGEADGEMASLFGERIRRELHREDWIRTISLVGCGVALALVAQGMGLIGNFGG